LAIKLWKRTSKND